ncbi:MAG: serine/threonine protein kinase [Dehalococcoidia bacterium]|nr:serine/threonine protein kinase [Dehalococcoidia bacterium]
MNSDGGGMGTVYEAIDSRDGGRVAVKLLHPWLAAEDTSFRDRFEREAHIAALLRSPYSVRLLDFGVADGTYFLVMEYVEGTTVGGELEQGPMEPVRALRIAIDVARALEEAAARGVVHRDIKPDNILLTSDGRVKVTDFGIARQEGGTGLTSAGRFVGTAEYAAPEQAVGEADHRSDIYSLGATLYCMLAGHPPFQATSVWDLLREHQSTPVSMAPLVNLPDSITNPIRRCLEKDPRDRYQGASELAGALERALASLLHGTQAPKASRAPGPGTAGPHPGETPKAGEPPPQPDIAATRVGEPPPPQTSPTVVGAVPPRRRLPRWPVGPLPPRRRPGA